MKKTSILLVSVGVATAIIFSLTKEKNVTRNHSNSYIEQLKKEMSEYAVSSTKWKKIAAKINKLKQKEALKERPYSDPSAFWDGLAAIKTNSQGKTYPRNHQKKEFEKAIRNKKKTAVPLNWKSRGPYNVSGRSRVIAVDPSDETDQTWFVGSVGGGVWKTADAGTTWENKTPNFTTLSTTTIAISQSNPDIIYIGTGQGYGRVIDLTGSGVWKSIDGGETWAQLASTANGELLQAINRIVVDPNNPDVLVLCSNNSYTHYGPEEGDRTSGIFKSIDGGITWTQTFFPDAVLGTATDNRVQQVIADPSDFNRLYATVNEVGVLYSDDAGDSWQISANNFALQSDIGVGTQTFYGGGISTRVEMAIAPSDHSRLYAAVERRAGVGDLYMSSDSGATWVLLNDTGNDPNWFSASGLSGAQTYQAGWFNSCLAVDPFNKDLVYLGGVWVYKATIDSVNSQRTTVYSGAGLHADNHYMKIVPNNDGQNYRILISNDGGMGFSDDFATSWTQTKGMLTGQLYGVDKKPNDDAYIIGMQDNSTWFSPSDPDETTNWISAGIGGDGVEAVWHYGDSTRMMGGSQGGNLSRSIDAGANFIANRNANTGLGPFITKIATSKQDPDLLFTIGSNGVSRSSDFGDNWTLTPITGNWLGFRPFANVEISLSDPRVLWITSRIAQDPITGGFGGVHVSKDGGLTFTEVTANLPNNLTESSGIAFHPTDANTVYLLFSAPNTPKIMRTNDAGQNWEDISGFSALTKTGSNGFPDVATFSLLQMPYNTDILWAGTEIGLFESTDNGQTWAYADNGLDHVAIFEMKIVDEQVIIATHSNGVYTVDLPELVGHKPLASTLMPRIKELYQTPQGFASIRAELRSAYDSTLVLINGLLSLSLTTNESVEDTTLQFPVTEDGSFSAQVISYKNGEEYKSENASIAVYKLGEASESFFARFEDSGDANKIVGSQHNIAQITGFSSSSIQFPHPYGAATDYIFTLRNPIKLKASNATLKYKDIAIIETGAAGSTYGQSSFFDYVVVEASIDGTTWQALEDGYDANANSQWLATYNAQGTPAESMYVNHSLDLLTHFNAGDEILIRFRLFSDPAAVAWGWTVDDILIQVEDGEAAEMSYQFAQNPSFPKNASIFIKPSKAVNTISLSHRFESENTTKTLNLELFDSQNDISTYLNNDLLLKENEKNYFYISSKVNNEAGIENEESDLDTLILENYLVTEQAKEIALSQSILSLPANSLSQSNTIVLSERRKDRYLNEQDILKYELILAYEASFFEKEIEVEFKIPKSKRKNYRVEFLNDGTWEELSANLSDNGLAINTKRMGNYRLVESSEINTKLIEVSDYKLAQNYPNPFNPITSINYQIKEKTNVKLYVFNNLGQVIVTLINGEKNKGTHTVKWNGLNKSGQKVASGIYFYQLVTSKKVITKKMILLK